MECCPNCFPVLKVCLGVTNLYWRKRTGFQVTLLQHTLAKKYTMKTSSAPPDERVSAQYITYVPASGSHFPLTDSMTLTILYINGITQYLSFCDWLISVSILFSHFICIVSYGMIFLFKVEQYSTICISFNPFICWWIFRLFPLLECWE